MSKNPLSGFNIAKQNISQRPVRSLCIIFLLLIFTLCLFLGSVTSIGLFRGVNSLSDRLGADIMIVPEGTSPRIESILLTGKPSNFYLPKDTLQELEKYTFIEKMTAQTYLATLSSSCCSYPLQIIGIDTETDFLITPWLKQSNMKSIEDNQIIIGYHVTGEIGETIQFFGKDYEIAGRLQQTGMAFDSSVFANRNTIMQLASDAQRLSNHPLNEDGSLISTIMIRIKPGYSSPEAAKIINEGLKGKKVFALFSKKLVNSITDNLSFVSWIIRLGMIALWILSFIIIALVFSFVFYQRRKELSVLRILGASRAKIISIAIKEVFLESLYGGLTGLILGLVLVLILSPLASQRLNMPFLLPPVHILALIAFACLLISMLSSILASSYSIIKNTKTDLYLNMRGND